MCPARTRTATFVPLIALIGLLVGCAGHERGGPTTQSAETVPAVSRSGAAPSRSGEPGPAQVLRAWDADRARAFATGDVTALRQLYVDGSTAGTSDVRLLSDYLGRSLRVEGMRMQLLELAVLRTDDRSMVLRVTDRLTGAVVAGPDGRTRLPADRASTRMVELRRDGGRWRVASVRGWSAPTPGGR